jgi:adenosylcobinamide kinase/adenosylcobinamide-phosphate guanylyltransferase
MKELILGGVRSGKSRLAEQHAKASALEVVYIATARPGDDAGLQERVQFHRASRPAHWPVVEAPLALADALQANATANRCLLVDCLTLWLTNLLLAEDSATLAREREALLRIVPQLPGRLILVGNETGLGIVPLGELSRRFVDEAGSLHQRLAQQCDRVIFTVAGLPHYLKGTPP